MLGIFFERGLRIPLPNPWVPGLALRLLRWDLDPTDSRVGVTLQIEW